MRFEHVLWRLCAAALVVAAAAGPAPARAQDDFQQGLDAYLNGEYRRALELWKPAAGSGDEVAAFNVGVLYARGLGVETDPGEALRWYRQSALAGYANAQFNLGAAYYDGAGTRVNIGQAVAWWEKAAEQDHPEAMYNLGVLYRDGKAVERNIERAIMLFRKGASAGDARAASALAQLKDQLPSDEDVAERPEAASGPDRGSAPGQGNDWPENENPEHWTVQVFAAAETEAARQFVTDHDLSGKVRIYEAETDGKTWFKGVSGSYADQGAARAARDELEKHLPGAPPWIRRYRDIQAEAVAEISVGVDAPVQAAREPAPEGDSAASSADNAVDTDAATPATGEADGEPASPITADEAAPGEEAAGSEATDEASLKPEAASGEQTRLRQGQRAFNAQDYETAFEIWQPLAENGVPDAQYGIGFMYESGWGVEQDYSQAYRWYQLAAQQEHVKSQFNLGMLYRNGKGVARNDALGLYWIQTAADRGDERALNYLKNLN